MTTEVTASSVFLENMRRLWRHDPELAQRIDEVPIDASLALQPTKAGPPTASVTTEDGRTLLLHSRYDPFHEAREFCASLQTDDAACVVLSGLGLGYHPRALIEHFGKETIIIICEPDLVALKTALETTDLAEAVGSGQIEFITSLDKAALHQRLSRHSASMMLGTVFAVPPVARDHNAAFHAACRDAITDFAAYAKVSLTTLVRNAAITCRNVANNLPTYVATPPPDLLRNRFSGYPAILVAAGPSLSKNVHLLQGLGDKAVIIAAQTTLRPLLERGIRPHFVTSLDFSDLSRQFFEGLDVPEEVVLVAEPKASWQVIDAFRCSAVPSAEATATSAPAISRCHMGGDGAPAISWCHTMQDSAPADSRCHTDEGAAPADSQCHKDEALRRVILLDNPFARRCVGDELARRASMEAGATVMHLAFYLAQWLACNPIIFIGQDLAFGGHCYYAPGVAMHRAWAPELGRYCTLEMKEWERIARQRRTLRKVPDIDGRPIYTDEQMFTYLQQFERDFAGCSAQVIDATEGGARKTGAASMRLADAIAEHCRRPIPPPCFDYLRAAWFDPSRLRPARKALAARLEELTAFRDLCAETRTQLEELTGLVETPAEFNRRIARVDELRTVVQQHELIYRMVRDVSQLAELQKIAADRRITVDEATGKHRARRQLQRDRRFMEALLQGCDELQRILDDSLARFDDGIAGAAAAPGSRGRAE